MFRVALTRVGAPALAAAPSVAPARSMATLKEISMRLKSVKSIQKITASMKMVSAAKFARAERALRESRALGPASRALVDKSEIDLSGAKKQVFVGVTSDRGLCGGVHSGIAKAIRAKIDQLPESTEVKLVAVGDKARSLLQRQHGDKMLLSANELGRKPPNFGEAAFVAAEVLNSGFEFDKAEILYNRFKSAVAYEVQTSDLPSLTALEAAPELDAYDDVDSDSLRSYMEFNFAANLFYAMLENTASEQSARMTAMENATSNAGEMIENLQLTFNRTRQAVITRELIEIISGASALE